MLKRGGVRIAWLALLLALSACTDDTDTVAIRAVSLVPSQTPFTEDFLAWIKEVNEQADGLFKIIYVGGPEAVPSYEQADALRTGVVHMMFGPGTYYLGNLPEIGALFASDLSPMESRASGGVALLDRLHLQRMGARFLGRAQFLEFHVYTRERPAIKADGLPDLENLRIRGGAVWREFFTDLSAVFVNLAPTDIYTALERGTIDGVGWPIVGLGDTSWDRHLRYRIDPGVYSSDVGLLFNAEKWDSLSAPAQAFLEAAVIDYERDSYLRFKTAAEQEGLEMQKSGMTVVELNDEGASRYQQRSVDVIWERIQAYAPENYAELRAAFRRVP
jgi:TRAP-type C4-dicarboxylate transport system substrate-binding protein